MIDSRLSLLVLALGACTPVAPAPATTPSPVRLAGDSAKGDSAGAAKPYSKVITAKAVTQRGLVISHRIGEKLYFEVPTRVLGADLLLVGSLARASAGQERQYGGDWLNRRVIRWEERDRRVLLRSVSYEVVADTSLPIARAVAQSEYGAVLASFPIETFGPDSAPVIDVTRLYTTGIPEMAAFKEGLDEKRSFIERVSAFPDNVEVEATQTADGKDHGPASSVLAHWSMVRLPVVPMTARRADPRVGFFLTEQIDYGTTEPRAAKRQYIGRWRLTKKDPAAAVSEPVAPIVYYIDPTTPTQWVPWIKKGIEDWQPVFEAAGFSHAIVAKDAPVGDPSWSPDNVRHTVIRWLPSTTENAYGPQIVDPRTGEVLNGSVRVYHNVLNLVRDWYITQVGVLDPRVKTLPLPDSLMGRLLEYVIAHEVGHTLGLRHNMQASSEYPADSVRSRTWIHRMGFCASVMDYCRFDYVAQPEDSIPVGDLIPRIAPYDYFAIHWGYAPIDVETSTAPGSGGAGARPLMHVRATDAERPVLDAWARAQDSVPWFRYEGDEGNAGPDPGVQSEAVGDADAVKSTTAGFANIARTVPRLMTLAVRPGEPDDDLKDLFDRLIGQWQLEVRQVVKVVGGEYGREKSGSQTGPRFTPVPADRQRAAVRFLVTHAFATPTYFLDPALLARLGADVGDSALARVKQAQSGVVQSLLRADRLERLADERAMVGRGGDAYDPAELMSDVRVALWSELTGGSVKIDAFRRSLQRAHLVALDALVNPINPTSGKPDDKSPVPTVDRTGAPRAGEGDARALARSELAAIRDAARRALPRAGDAVTRAHLTETIAEVTRSLEPAPAA